MSESLRNRAYPRKSKASHFIGVSRKRGTGSALAFLERALDVALVGFFPEILPLVVVVFAGGERERELRAAVLEVDLERHERPALFARLAEELHDLRLVQQEFSAAQGIVVELVALVVGAHMHVLEIDLAVLDEGEAVLEIRLACAQGFHLRADELDARLVGLVDEVVIARLAVLADDLDGDVVLAHGFTSRKKGLLHVSTTCSSPF